MLSENMHLKEFELTGHVNGFVRVLKGIRTLGALDNMLTESTM